MPERDENTEAVCNVEEATESDSVKGEELLESEELKQRLRDAKSRVNSEKPIRHPSKPRNRAITTARKQRYSASDCCQTARWRV
jgi:hypothetical protein